MKRTQDFLKESERPLSAAFDGPSVEQLLAELKTNGIVALPSIVSSEQLARMRRAFEAKLSRLRWNNFDGYEKTEPYRHMIEDVLLLDQGFLDLAVQPIVKKIVREYLGEDVELTEARGWKSLPTKRDFHGWHGDAWYDQDATPEIQRELKLAVYLTDVRSGAFNYMLGTHLKQHPRPIPNAEIIGLPPAQIVEMMGPAGTAFMFDTSGIHRQGVPMLEERMAVFYNYHDPKVRLQEADRTAYRYHPILLNAAFLGNLSEEDEQLLGFGNKTNFVPAYVRPSKPPFLYHAFFAALTLQLRIKSFRERISARLDRILGRN